MARILLAEDDDDMRGFLTRALSRAGHEVRPCADGLEALSAAERSAFDLLVADVVMPGMDGMELARHAVGHIPDLKVVFITGFAAVALRARRLNLPGSTVLSKPFHLRKLVSHVERLLAA
ncbi:MAG: response regulator [Alphaproteobacteria bacterium]